MARIEFNYDTNARETAREVRRLAQEVDRTERTQDRQERTVRQSRSTHSRLNRELRQTGSEIRSVGRDAESAERRFERLNRQAARLRRLDAGPGGASRGQRVFQALGRSGTAIDSRTNSIGEAIGIGGGVGTLAATAVGLGLVTRSLMSTLEKDVQIARQIVQDRTSLRNEVRQARRSAGDAAAGFIEGQSGALRQVTALGGSAGIDLVRNLAGAGFRQAPQTAASLLRFGEDERAGALEAADLIARSTGQSVLEALTKIRPGQIARSSVDQVFREQAGDTLLGRTLTAEEGLRTRLNVDSPIGEARRVVGGLNRLELANAATERTNLQNLLTPEGFDASVAAVGRGTIDLPRVAEARAITESSRARREEVDQLREVRETMSDTARLWDDIAFALRGVGINSVREDVGQAVRRVGGGAR